MATPEAPVIHQAAQAVVLSGLADAVRNAFGLLVPDDLAGSVPKVQAAIYALVAHYGRASSALALQHYQQQRGAAGTTSRAPALRMAPLPPHEQVDINVRWSVAGTDSEAKLRIATERLSLNNGRDSMIGFTNQDRAARGFAREAHPGACAFCRMLATRGAVYKNEKSGGRAANSRFVGDGQFKFHDNCRCTIEPVFGTYEPTATTRADQALWSESTGGVTGMKAKQIAFRRAVEGRTDPAPSAR